MAFRMMTEIGIIAQLANNQMERSLPDGLKMSQFGVLHHLVRLGGSWSPARLANAFQVTKGAMTNSLQRLEKRRLVQIKADPDDGRGKLVSITGAGVKMRTRCIENISPLLVDLATDISAANISQVLPVLEKLRKHLDTRRS